MTQKVRAAAIVCGGRGGTGQGCVDRAMDLARVQEEVPRFQFVTVGSGRGTDYEVYSWALRRELAVLTCPARWKTGKVKGPPAGPKRNRRMYRWVCPVVVLAFPGGSGTADMVDVACAGGTPAFWWSESDLLWFLDERCALPDLARL